MMYGFRLYLAPAPVLIYYGISSIYFGLSNASPAHLWSIPPSGWQVPGKRLREQTRDVSGGPSLQKHMAPGSCPPSPVVLFPPPRASAPAPKWGGGSSQRASSPGLLQDRLQVRDPGPFIRSPGLSRASSPALLPRHLQALHTPIPSPSSASASARKPRPRGLARASVPTPTRAPPFPSTSALQRPTSPPSF